MPETAVGTDFTWVNLAYYSLERLSRTRKRWSIRSDKEAEKATDVPSSRYECVMYISQECRCHVTSDR